MFQNKAIGIFELRICEDVQGKCETVKIDFVGDAEIVPGLRPYASCFIRKQQQ